MALHNDLGRKGETLACQFLSKKGYTILQQNWRNGRNEADIIAKFDNTLIFIEVKTRKSEFFGLPESFVSNTQKKAMAKLSEAYCTLKNIDDAEIRYDIIAIILNKKQEKVLHFEDAFFPEI